MKSEFIILRALETPMMHYIGNLFIICLLAALTVPSIVSGNEVRLSVDSTGYPSFYRDESITLTCTASGDTDVVAVYLVNGDQVNDKRTSCGYNSFGNEWVPTNLLNVPGFSTINITYCEAAAAAAPPFILSIPGIISDDLRGVNFRCYADIASRVNSTPFSISTINAKPENLVLNLPDKIAERREFTFNCTSTGGSPDSVYEYEVLKEDVVVESSNRYTPTKEDRDGLTLRCKDTTHLVLETIYRDRIIMSKEVEPRYIDYGEEPHYDLEHNPGGPLTLTCKVVTDSNSNPTYKWSCSTCSDTDVSDQLVISMDSRQDGQTEQFNCTASIESVGEITITWTVAWTFDVTIPPTTQPTTTTKLIKTAGLPIGAIVGIAIGGVVLIAVVIIIIFFFCRKNKGGKGDPVSTTEKNQSGRKSKSTHKNEKNQNSQSNTNNPVPAVKYADDSIVYAVLEHDNNPARVAKVKPTKPQQPPEDALPYMSIDFNATEALKQRRNGDDNHYENCNDEPTTSSARPTTSSARPTTPAARPTTSSARPTTSSARPTTRVPLPPRANNV